MDKSMKSRGEAFLGQFSALMRYVKSSASETYAALELSNTQAHFLRLLSETVRSQAELARATGSDPALTGRALEPLIERGLVRRKRSADDRRQYVVELTAAGHRANAKAGGLRADLTERITSALSSKDFDDFARISERILGALEKNGPAISAPRRVASRATSP
jgi:DNA-binding MarR family transcriptional regulator